MRSNSKFINEKKPRILLAGVFGPFAQDDAYGSRKVNPMELYHNQVTRVQGPFSLRMFHRTFGLLMIEANIDAPCTILEFATLERFIREIKNNEYDIIGISSIVPNTGKVKKMCEEIRRESPGTTIVVGGHIANRDDLNRVIDADHICRGDGIEWFRKFLGQDINAPIKHPAIISGFGTRILGFTIPGGKTAATLIPSVGCPMGCNFCCTSALFGGKGHSVVFYKTGDEMFSVLCQLEKKLKVNSFFVLDENFLFYKERALRLLELMKENGKSWAFYIFSSARVLESYTIDQLVSLGVSWVWMGLEGEKSRYNKLSGVDTMGLVEKFKSHGIRVLGSTIIGLENHTDENIYDAIDYAVSHDTDFHQFMLYTPLPGTPLYKEHFEKNEILSEEECPAADAHGQERFNYRHPRLKNNMEKEYLLEAFRRDFAVNGPSLYRITRTTLAGWKKYRNHNDRRVVNRFKSDISGFSTGYAAAIWAMARWYRDDEIMSGKMKALLKDMYLELGFETRIVAPLLGRIALSRMKSEAKRLDSGWSYEPSAIYEKNALAKKARKKVLGLFGGRISRMKLPVYDLSRVLSICRSEMDEVHRQMAEFLEKSRLKLENIKEQTTEKRESAAAQVARIRADILDLAKKSQGRLDDVCDKMTAQYEESRKQIGQARNAMTIKCRDIQKQVDEACAQIEALLESGMLPDN